MRLLSLLASAWGCAMSYIKQLRAALTGAGATPQYYDEVRLLRQLVTAYGGTPTQFEVKALLREPIVARGATPATHAEISLLRQLVTVLGATPTSYSEVDLWSQLAILVPGGTPDTTAPTITSSATQTVAENSLFTLSLTANEVVTWSK